MALSYAELIAATTKDEELRKLLELLTLAGFPATSWQPGSVPRTILEAEAEVLAEAANTIRQIALGGMLEEAEDDWLTLLARSVFSLERLPALRTRGVAVLTCSPHGGPYTISVGSITAANPAGKIFRNITGGVLPSGGTLALTFEAESPGAAYNIATGDLTRMISQLAGVTISNPVVSGSSTWITRTGADEETDEQLRERCKARWATLGAGATDDAYIFWARSAHPEVKRVKVLGYSDHGVPTPGHVTLYLAGDTGSVSSGSPGDAVETVREYVEERRPLVVTTHVENAIEVSIPVAAQVFVQPGTDLGQTRAALAQCLEELIRSIDIGGTVYRSAIIEALMTPDGVVNTTLSQPAADVSLAFSEVGVFSYATGGAGATIIVTEV